MFSEDKLSHAGQKNNKVLVQKLFTQIYLTVLNTKNCISKLPTKMFIKRKTSAGKAYTYRTLLSFKTPATYNYFLISRWATVSVVKQLSSGVIRFFVGHCPDLRILEKTSNAS